MSAYPELFGRGWAEHGRARTAASGQAARFAHGNPPDHRVRFRYVAEACSRRSLPAARQRARHVRVGHGAAFAMGYCGLVEATVEGHAAYLDSWWPVLRGDRSAIFTAARHAGEAFEFIRAQEMPVLDDMATRSGPDDA